MGGSEESSLLNYFKHQSNKVKAKNRTMSSSTTTRKIKAIDQPGLSNKRQCKNEKEIKNEKAMATGNDEIETDVANSRTNVVDATRTCLTTITDEVKLITDNMDKQELININVSKNVTLLKSAYKAIKDRSDFKITQANAVSDNLIKELADAKNLYNEAKIRSESKRKLLRNQLKTATDECIEYQKKLDTLQEDVNKANVNKKEEVDEAVKEILKRYKEKQSIEDQIQRTDKESEQNNEALTTEISKLQEELRVMTENQKEEIKKVSVGQQNIIQRLSDEVALLNAKMEQPQQARVNAICDNLSEKYVILTAAKDEWLKVESESLQLKGEELAFTKAKASANRHLLEVQKKCELKSKEAKAKKDVYNAAMETMLNSSVILSDDQEQVDKMLSLLNVAPPMIKNH